MLLMAATACGAEARPLAPTDAGSESPEPRADAALAGRGAAGMEGAPPLDAGPPPMAADAEPADAGPPPMAADAEPADASIEPGERDAGTRAPPPELEPLPPFVGLELPIAGTCAFEPQPIPAPVVDNPACPDGIHRGDVVVRGPADLKPLRDCTRLAGSLTVDSPTLEQLDGLESLRVIEGSLVIDGPTCTAGSCTTQNAKLQSLRGLQQLRCVSGDMTLRQPADRFCDPLDLTALRRLVEVGGSLTLDVCAGANVDGLDSLQRVWGDLMSRVRITPERLQAVYGALTTTAPSTFPAMLYVGCREGSTPCRDGFLGCAWRAERQADVAPLALCEVALRDLTLTGTSITSLAPLAKLREIRGDLVIGLPPGVTPGAELGRLATLAGLELLTHVRRLSIAHSPFIASLSPLSNLTSARAIRIENLDGLLDLVGLEQVAQLRGTEDGEGVLRIAGNAALETLTGLTLTAAEEVQLEDNAALSSIAALAPLTGALDRLVLRSLPQLNSLDGLQHVSAIGSLEIVDCAGLIDLTELALASSRAITLSNVPSLSTLQGFLLPDLRRLERLELSRLPSLQSLAGLESIQAADLRVADCDGLIDLTGLDAFERGSLSLVDNALLTRLEGAPELAELELLELERNRELRTLAGLPKLTRAGVRMIDLPRLESFAALSGVQLTRLELEQLPIPVDLLGLEGAVATLSRLTIVGNLELVDLAALANVAQVEGELAVSMNPRLLNLHGLEGVRRAMVRIDDNEALEQIRALVGLEAGSLSIARNPSLPECEVDWMRERLAIPILAADNGPPGSCSP